jgi:uncharacterized protein YbjT (DUF2867 family)
MRVLATVATGSVGRRLVPALVRDAGRYGPPPGVRVVVGDPLDPGSFEDALAVDAAYSPVHSMSPHDDFAARDRRAARNFADAASAAGMAWTVYLGGLGEERHHLSAHLQSRREVERVLATGTYALTTLRVAIVVGPRSAGFEMVVQLASRLPVTVTPRWVRTHHQPTAVADLLAYLAGAFGVPEAAGETHAVDGPEVVTYPETIRRTGRHPGNEPVVGTDDRLPHLVPVDPTPFDEAVRRAPTDRSVEAAA